MTTSAPHRRMRGSTPLIVAVLLGLSSVGAWAERGIAVRPRSPSGAEVKGDQWLFVVGIDSYIHWPRLKTAVNDARAVRDVLLSRYHFDKDHLIQLYDEQATRKNIIGKLRDLASKVRPEDSLVIFYAGHGHLDALTKAGSWIPVESGVKEASAWVSNHDIKNLLRSDAIKAKHILLISDSCFAGDFFRGHRGKLPEPTDKAIRRAYRLTSRQAIASGGLEPVVDAGFGGNSVFSHFLVKVLKENQKPFLVPSDFFPDIRAGVAENAEQFPAFGALKGTGGQQGGELVMFLRHAPGLKRLAGKVAARQKEFKRLKRMEAAATATARRKEADEIRKKEREVAALDAKIKEMKKRLGTPGATEGDSLDAMVTMVQEKEAQEKRLAALKKRREEEKDRRLAEIERLRAEKRSRIAPTLKRDISKYKRIVSSPYGKEMKEAAWRSLLDKYPEATKGLKAGDIGGLLEWAIDPSFINSVGMKFVLIPAGTFMMGSPKSEKRGDSERQHKVTISEPFYMQTTEVTQGQWKKVMGDNPSHFKKCGDTCPVERVSWHDAQEFITRLNKMEGVRGFRLPTEAEWEYAARAGTQTPFHYGASLSSDQANSDRGKTMPVGSFEPNSWGLYDMHGNVREWCEDRYGRYPMGDVIDPTGPSTGSGRVERSGSWDGDSEHSRLYTRSAARHGFAPTVRYKILGVRLARDAQ